MTKPQVDFGVAQHVRVVLLWIAVAAMMAATVAAGIRIGGLFAQGQPATVMPIIGFTLGFTSLGVAFLLLIPLIEKSQAMPVPIANRLLVGIFLVGLGLRLALLASQPILEVDFNRYLWDGALTANGFNPYAIAPGNVVHLPYDDLRLELSKAASSVFEGISYPQFKTIYPPVAQAAFALSYLLTEWSLTGWRLIAISADVATFALLVSLLRATNRSPLWVTLYWWCPLVLKEVANSAHMEAILLPLLLASLFLAVRGRHLWAITVLGFAIGTKLWPVMLVPLMLRPLLQHPRALVAAIAILAGTFAATVLPVWLGGFDASSGFLVFATSWTTNSALFPLLERGVALLTGTTGTGSNVPGAIVRLLAATVVLGLSCWLSWQPIDGARGLVQRAYLICTALLVLSPAQFPWYILWVLPLAVLNVGIGWHIAAALVPIYYSAFHFIARQDYLFYETKVIWIIWVPVWVALAFDVKRVLKLRAGC